MDKRLALFISTGLMVVVVLSVSASPEAKDPLGCPLPAILWASARCRMRWEFFIYDLSHPGNEQANGRYILQVDVYKSIGVQLIRGFSDILAAAARAAAAAEPGDGASRLVSARAMLPPGIIAVIADNVVDGIDVLLRVLLIYGDILIDGLLVVEETSFSPFHSDTSILIPVDEAEVADEHLADLIKDNG